MSWFTEIVKTSRYDEKLHQIVKKAERQPAVMSGKVECQRSGVCCWKRPCDLHQGDVERMAAHLGLTVEETFRQHLVVDLDSTGYKLRPRRAQQEGGRMLTADETYDIDTPCVFLQADSLCRVHDAKPTGGRDWTCSMTAAERDALPVPRWTEEQLVALGWDGYQE